MLYRDPSGKCLGYWWGDPTCQFVGGDRAQWDYAGAGQNVVIGLGTMATVLGCAGTGGIACVAGSAVASGVTSWDVQAIANAGTGQSRAQALRNVDGGRVILDGAIGGLTGKIGSFAGGVLAKYCLSGQVCASLTAGIIGSVSSGASQFLNNVTSSKPAFAGVLAACASGFGIGALMGYGLQRLSFPLLPPPKMLALL